MWLIILAFVTALSVWMFLVAPTPIAGLFVIIAASLLAVGLFNRLDDFISDTEVAERDWWQRHGFNPDGWVVYWVDTTLAVGAFSGLVLVVGLVAKLAS